MMQLNSIGGQLAELPGVHAMTDVTGFGLGGHLVEMCEASGISATVIEQALPLMDAEAVLAYIDKGCIPGGTHRNFQSYGEKISALTDSQKAIICDPQTSGGLLLAIAPEAGKQVSGILSTHGLYAAQIGAFTAPAPEAPLITLG